MTGDVLEAIRALTGSDIQTAEKAALALFEAEIWTREDLPHDEITEALADSIEGGNLSPAAFLILARLDGPDALEVLTTARKGREDIGVKLRPWDRPVMLAVALFPALTLAGDLTARNDWLASLEAADADQTAYYLAVIDFIDDPAVLHQLARGLDDFTEVGGGVPSGGTPSATRRRIADRAVDAFVTRLSLKMNFDPRPHGQYSPAEIADVKAAIRNTIPQ